MSEPIKLKRCLCVLDDLRETLRNGGSANSLDYSCFGWPNYRSINHLLSRRASFSELKTLLGYTSIDCRVKGKTFVFVNEGMPDIKIENSHSLSQSHLGLYVLAWIHVHNLFPSLDEELLNSHRELT